MSNIEDRAARVANFLRGLHQDHGGLESFYGGTAEERHQKLEAPGLPPEVVDGAARGLESVLAGGAPSAAQLEGLEAIVMKDECPTLEIFHDGFVEPPRGRWERLAKDEGWLKTFVGKAGRLDCPTLPGGYVGTGFLVGDGLVMTNRHVALMFAHPDTRALARGVALDVRHERREPRVTDALQVLKVLLIHPFWDVALLKVETTKKEPLVLAAEQPPKIMGREIAVIGYPYFTFTGSDYEWKVLLDNFGDTPGYKRLQPGRLRGRVPYEPEGKSWPAFSSLGHDASTLGGNSGSMVVDLDGKVVLGVHFGGREFDVNWSVPTWELFRDPRIRDAEVRFAPASGSPPPPDGEVEKAWQSTGATRSAVSVLTDLTTGGVSPGVEAPAEVEAAEAPRIDPELPEIVLIHGLFGAHLDGVGALGRRAWLSPSTFRGSLAAGLSLQPDGLTDLAPGQQLAPSELLSPLYRSAVLRWRSAGYIVHEFSFDWRKRVEVAADRLHFALEGLSVERPRRFALVAHGMGALVACVYAQRHRAWQERVQRAILVGAPLHGSFAAMEAATGTHPLQRKLADLEMDDNHLDALHRMALSFPSLTQMLPDPEVFPAAAALYASATWPDASRPPQSALDGSHNLKAVVRNSPLLDRAAVIACINRGTCDSLGYEPARVWAGPRTGPGDGTVPAASAIVTGRPLAIVDEDHMLLFCAADTCRAVDVLLREGVFPADLAKEPTAVDRQRRLEPPPEIFQRLELFDPASPEEQAKARLRREIDLDLLRWLFDASIRPPPVAG